MSEIEQAAAALRVALAMPDVAAAIADYARENLGGTEVVSVGSVFAREIQGVTCYLVAAIVPDRDGKDFVPSQVILDTTQNQNANGAHPAVLCELPRNRGSAGFRGLQVRDILPMLIYVHALAAQDVKEVRAHPVNFLPRADASTRLTTFRITFAQQFFDADQSCRKTLAAELLT